MRIRGWRVSLVTARPAPIEGVELLVLPPVRRSLDWFARIGPGRSAVAALKPDLLHAHYLTSYGFLAACCPHPRRLMTAWGTDLLVTPQLHFLMRALTVWTLGRAHWMTGDSQDLLDTARALRPGLNCSLVHWGVERSRFSPRPWAEKPGFETLSLRSWEPNYRIDALLEAFALVCSARPDRALRLHLLGGGSQESALRVHADLLGLSDAVQWHGRLDDAGMAAVMAKCKLSISVPESDATSVSVLESMACGLAVIASDLPANRAWLDTTVLVPAGAADALAATWLRLIDDDAHCAAIGAANAERIRRDGDRAVQMDAVDRLYHQLLAGPGGQS
jgi:glycosyltransferase involved in cell wall biosynthesis